MCTARSVALCDFLQFDKLTVQLNREKLAAPVYRIVMASKESWVRS